ncbi:hypothetical protein U1P98_04355 [Lysinibacillus irui]|uniref:Uncharacterized protein n=1 Tax=Lysinibacillus irui TaxID=2998077 RepID=A0ABU5NHR7_9BACI|nr:hypothetical protein [Lysinibacillus irui]MEA0552941.1 hypothetical protein [Lysinibacillus irui]MEA0975521.1 hypothetical protein [Lysinibacillus irui]MEA1041675.1 hypothetical protein [Lysinibacillus irui]
MLQGKCIDNGGSINLTKGEVYYLFPHGGHAYCASRFPRPGSHFGTYQENHFELVDVAIDAPARVLNKYLARVVKPPSHFYQIDEEYIITEPRADGYYSVFFKHRPDGPPIGAYKRTECFERIVNHEESAKDTATIFEVGDIVEIIDASIIKRKHYENGVQATVIENFYGCISIQRNEPIDRMVIGSVLLVGEELQAIRKVGSRTVLEAVMVKNKQEMVNQTATIECEISETVKVPVKKQKYEQLSLF